MQPYRLFTLAACLVFCTTPLIYAQEIDKELANLAVALAGKAKEQGTKKLAVIDFTDLDGNGSELGKYIAEQLTIDLVMEKREFAVLDRANLQKILAEHKLTSKGLVDPNNSKQLGKFAGVDAIIIGTIIPKAASNISLNAKIIATETAEIVGATRAEFIADSTVSELLSKPISGNVAQAGPVDDKAIFTKSFQDLRVDIYSLKIVNGTDYLLTMNVSNQNSKKITWVALSQNPNTLETNGRLTDSSGTEYSIDPRSLSGIASAKQYVVYGDGGFVYYTGDPAHPRFSPALKLEPNDSNPVTIKFRASGSAKAESGLCSIQMEFLSGQDFVRGAGTVDIRNLVCKINAQ
jgi:hypothetical protein